MDEEDANAQGMEAEEEDVIVMEVSDQDNSGEEGVEEEEDDEVVVVEDDGDQGQGEVEEAEEEEEEEEEEEDEGPAEGTPAFFQAMPVTELREELLYRGVRKATVSRLRRKADLVAKLVELSGGPSAPPVASSSAASRQPKKRKLSEPEAGDEEKEGDGDDDDDDDDYPNEEEGDDDDEVEDENSILPRSVVRFRKLRVADITAELKKRGFKDLQGMQRVELLAKLTEMELDRFSANAPEPPPSKRQRTVVKEGFIPLDIWRYNIMPFVGKLKDVVALATTEKGMMRHFEKVVWPKQREKYMLTLRWHNMLPSLTRIPEALLSTTRIGFILQGLCEICFDPERLLRRNNTDIDWGVQAHNECISKCIARERDVPDVEQGKVSCELHRVWDDAAGGRRRRRRYNHMRERYFWTKACLAFAGDSVSGSSEAKRSEDDIVQEVRLEQSNRYLKEAAARRKHIQIALSVLPAEAERFHRLHPDAFRYVLGDFLTEGLSNRGKIKIADVSRRFERYVALANKAKEEFFFWHDREQLVDVIGGTLAYAKAKQACFEAMPKGVYAPLWADAIIKAKPAMARHRDHLLKVFKSAMTFTEVKKATKKLERGLKSQPFVDKHKRLYPVLAEQNKDDELERIFVSGKGLEVQVQRLVWITNESLDKNVCEHCLVFIYDAHKSAADRAYHLAQVRRLRSKAKKLGVDLEERRLVRSSAFFEAANWALINLPAACAVVAEIKSDETVDCSSLIKFYQTHMELTESRYAPRVPITAATRKVNTKVDKAFSDCQLVLRRQGELRIKALLNDQSITLKKLLTATSSALRRNCVWALHSLDDWLREKSDEEAKLLRARVLSLFHHHLVGDRSNSQTNLETVRSFCESVLVIEGHPRATREHRTLVRQVSPGREHMLQLCFIARALKQLDDPVNSLINRRLFLSQVSELYALKPKELEEHLASLRRILTDPKKRITDKAMIRSAYESHTKAAQLNGFLDQHDQHPNLDLNELINGKLASWASASRYVSSLNVRKKQDKQHTDLLAELHGLVDENGSVEEKLVKRAYTESDFAEHLLWVLKTVKAHPELEQLLGSITANYRNLAGCSDAMKDEYVETLKGLVANPIATAYPVALGRAFCSRPSSEVLDWACKTAAEHPELDTNLVVDVPNTHEEFSERQVVDKDKLDKHVKNILRVLKRHKTAQSQYEPAHPNEHKKKKKKKTTTKKKKKTQAATVSKGKKRQRDDADGDSVERNQGGDDVCGFRSEEVVTSAYASPKLADGLCWAIDQLDEHGDLLNEAYLVDMVLSGSSRVESRDAHVRILLRLNETNLGEIKSIYRSFERAKFVEWALLQIDKHKELDRDQLLKYVTEHDAIQSALQHRDTMISDLLVLHKDERFDDETVAEAYQKPELRTSLVWVVETVKSNPALTFEGVMSIANAKRKGSRGGQYVSRYGRESHVKDMKLLLKGVPLLVSDEKEVTRAYGDANFAAMLAWAVSTYETQVTSGSSLFPFAKLRALSERHGPSHTRERHWTAVRTLLTNDPSASEEKAHTLWTQPDVALRELWELQTCRDNPSVDAAKIHLIAARNYDNSSRSQHFRVMEMLLERDDVSESVLDACWGDRTRALQEQFVVQQLREYPQLDRSLLGHVYDQRSRWQANRHVAALAYLHKHDHPDLRSPKKRKLLYSNANIAYEARLVHERNGDDADPIIF